MKIQMFQVDAFSENLFGGNPAAVCILNEWLEGSLMQKIAEENNLSETAFIVKRNSNYEIRWFTPKLEVDLCGHATLASAHVIFEYYKPKENEITLFNIHSGILRVKKDGDYLILDFPIGEYKITPTGVPVFNPAFDITSPELIRGIITEKGIIEAPIKDNILQILQK